MSDADSTTDGESAPDGRRRSTGFVVVSVLALVFFVSTVLLAVVAAGLKSDKDELTDGRRDVEEVAGEFVEAFLDFDYRDPATSHDEVLALSTPPFTEQFEAGITAIEASLQEFETVSTGTVKEVLVSEVAGGTATAVVVYDRVIDGASGRNTESNRYLRLSLVELEGGWRVNGVTDLNLVFTGSEGAEAG